MASRVRSVGGSSAAAVRTTSSSRSTSATLVRTVRALRTAPTSIRLHPLHFDPRDDARHPLEPRSPELPKRLRLGLGHDKLHDGRGVEVQELSGHGLRAVFAQLPEGIGALSGDRSLRRGEVEEVSLGRPGPSRGHQLPGGRAGFIDRTEHRNRLAALGHLEPLPRATRRRYRERFWRSSRTPTRSVAMCTHTVASLAKTFAPLSRSEAMSEDLR